MAPGHDDDALTIAELYDEVEDALAAAFPRTRAVWVRGEIQSVSDQTGRSGHCYVDLVDPDTAGARGAPSLKVKCWRSTWGPLRATLANEGVTLEPGMVVVLRGTLDFYRPKAEIGFVLTQLDVTALLGRLAAQRAALIKALAAEGLLERNRALVVPAVPLRVGLVASPGTEGFRDFLGQLTGSGFAFAVRVVPVSVQGTEAPAAIAAALGQLGRPGQSGDPACDLIVVVRGGGSKADLAAFDTETVARAVALSPLAVWTGIGHTGDESVADLVANRSFITPTECGHELALRVAAWWEDRAAGPGALVARRAVEVLAEATRRDALARGRLAGTARQQLRFHRERLAGRSAGLVRGAPVALGRGHDALTSAAARLGPLALGHLAREADRVGSWRRLLAAYDVDRQLERGYTLTLDDAGRVLRSVVGLAAGRALVTRFADGTARSVVESVQTVQKQTQSEER